MPACAPWPDSALWLCPNAGIAIAASVYVVAVLEILKLRRLRLRERLGISAGPPAPSANGSEESVDDEVAEELETGSFPAVRRP